MKQFLFLYALAVALFQLPSCAPAHADVTETLYSQGLTPRADNLLRLLPPDQEIEVLVDTSYAVEPVNVQLYTDPCTCQTVHEMIDGADGTGPKRTMYRIFKCQALGDENTWAAAYTWVLVQIPHSKEWVSCPALLKLNTTGCLQPSVPIKVKPCNVYLKEGDYANIILVQN